MNVARFLTPKRDVVCLSDRSTMRQALERMEAHRYSAVPILDEEGRYVATITEGDILFRIKHSLGTWREEAEHTPLMAIERRLDHRAVHIDAEMETLISLAIAQNFVPVVDDREVFVGIVGRKAIIEYCAKLIEEKRDSQRGGAAG